jgi:iron complex transport system substrate-binding protein
VKLLFEVSHKSLRVGSVRELLVVFAALLTLASSALAAGRTINDDLGFKIEIKNEIRRVVSLVPTNSEMVCLLDCAKLAGGTRHDQFPPELVQKIRQKQITVIGGGFDANLEKIVQLQPDLILTNGPTQQRFAVPLKNLGYPVVSLWPRDMAGLVKDFLLLGELLRQEQKAYSFIDDMRRRFQGIVAKASHKPKPRVYLQMWNEPLITVGGASFTDWLVGAAGGINVFGDLPFDSVQIGLESLIQKNPQWLVFLAGQASFTKSLAQRAGWSAIDGVRAGHYCFVEEPDIRRSIMFIDGLAKLQDCILRDGFATERQKAEPK